MDKYVEQMIKDISSAFARADGASRSDDGASELKHLLLAIHDISILLQGRLNDRIDAKYASSYAQSLVDSAKRIQELIESGVK